MFRVAEIVIMHIIGIALLFQGVQQNGTDFTYSFLYIAAALTFLGIASGRCGWLMHEGGHYSLTGNIAIDRSLQIVLYGVGCGMSGSWWRNQVK